MYEQPGSNRRSHACEACVLTTRRCPRCVVVCVVVVVRVCVCVGGGGGSEGRAKSYIGAMPSRRFCRCRIRLRLRLLSSCFLRVAARAYGTTPLGGLPHLPAATFRDPTETLGALLKNRCASSGSPRSYPSGHGAGPEIQWALPAQVRTLPIAFYNDRVFLQRLGMSARGPDRHQPTHAPRGRADA